MRAYRIEAKGFRVFPDLALNLPARGAVLVGPNGQGKTSLLEALYYPVLYRSLRGALDTEITRWGEQGFYLALEARSDRDEVREYTCGFLSLGRRKRIAIDGQVVTRLGDAIGEWLAVAFLPADLDLVQGPARGRRHYLDRILSLADPGYLRALTRYRSALSQRNAALREGRREVARAFDRLLAEHGSVLVARRVSWIEESRELFASECETLGEKMAVAFDYRGNRELADPSAWPDLLEQALPRDLTRGASLVGPHRDDLRLAMGNGKPLRDFGSRGQHRSAAIALKLCEVGTLTAAREAAPVLLLDDVFAELDRDRQDRLARRLRETGQGQTFVTAPRRNELPPELELEVLSLVDGQVMAGVGG